VVLGESPELKSQYRKKKYTHRAGEQVLGSVPSTKKQTKNPQVITIKAIGEKNLFIPPISSLVATIFLVSFCSSQPNLE
jgi:hypothetical protein